MVLRISGKLKKTLNSFQILNWDPSLTEDEAMQQFQRCQRIEQNFGDVFTRKIPLFSLEPQFETCMFLKCNLFETRKK